MDFTVNAKAEGRVVVPWEHIVHPNLTDRAYPRSSPRSLPSPIIFRNGPADATSSRPPLHFPRLGWRRLSVGLLAPNVPAVIARAPSLQLARRWLGRRRRCARSSCRGVLFSASARRSRDGQSTCRRGEQTHVRPGDGCGQYQFLRQPGCALRAWFVHLSFGRRLLVG